MPTYPTSITAAPTPPDRADRATFSGRATASFDHLKNNAIPEIAAVATNVYDNAAEAAAAAVVATAQANAALAAVGAVKWISGSTYEIGVVSWSPVDSLAYRRKTVGAGTIDPSADATNWQAISGDVSSSGSQTLTNKTLGSGTVFASSALAQIHAASLLF